MTRATVKFVGRPFLRSAMDAVTAKVVATVPKAIATAILATKEGTTTMQGFEEREPKVHLFHDNAEERAKGKKRMKDIFCRGNSGNKITNNPKNVTCLRCLRRMEEVAKISPGGVTLQHMDEMSQTIKELEAEIEDWKRDADRLADILNLTFKNIEDDRQHVIVVMGTQITLGQVIYGTMALHDLVTEKHKRTD